MSDKASLRSKDFWTALVLIAVSLFFLFKTAQIPFFKAEAAGVDAAEWYNSAALIPYGIFATLLFLSIGLLAIAIKDGGARHAMASLGRWSDHDELLRVVCIVGILLGYIAGLVPRVDFIVCSALCIAALTYGFHTESKAARVRSLISVILPAIYAVAMHPTRDEWAKPHDDDWVALASFVILVCLSLRSAKRRGECTRVTAWTPVVALLAPTILVTAMAFGFRQNVPNRTGLIFSQIEYHYYVDLVPILRGK